MSGISAVTTGNAYATMLSYHAGGCMSPRGLLTEIDWKYSMDLGEADSISSKMSSEPYLNDLEEIS